MIQLRGFSFLFFLIYSFSSNAQNVKLNKLWETDPSLKVPESVVYYAAEKILFVSNIDGKPNEKDLKGSISKVSLDGKQINNWAINLSAPKGMGIYMDKIYVADIDEVVSIELKNGKIAQRFPVEGAVFLNDLTIDNAGIIYVSDSKTGKIHQIDKGKVTTYLENQSGVNGLLCSEQNLFFLANGNLWKADSSKSLTKIAEGMDESTDGIEMTKNKEFIISCWNGVVYNVKSDGSKTELLDTREQKINAADIGFDHENGILYIPTFFSNKVYAYKLD